MTSRIAKTLVAALLLGVSGWASASLPAIDLFKAPGIPGSGGHQTVMGPCYCDQDSVYTEVIPLAPGTYDFGVARDYWVQSGYTPDGGPDQPNLYLLFSPWEVSGEYPYDFPPPLSYAYPSSALCAQTDDACNASYDGAYFDTKLVFTIAPGQDGIQVGFVGPFTYISPLPEPLESAMVIVGLALVAGIAKRRREASRAG